MNKIEKLVLIEGEFSHEEAKEILFNLFTSKINYHNLQNWSSMDRFGKDDDTAQKRIPELKKEIEKLQIILSQAEMHNKKLIVNSQINITIADE